MRIERHDDGGGAPLIRRTPDAVENLPVTAVHAVEVAEREDGLRPARRALIVRKMNNVHRAPNTPARCARMVQ
jgi:hypothetical protein